MIRQIFNQVMKQEDSAPETWRIIRIKVVYKKGHVEEVRNYRLICTLPALYKLFSTLKNNRLHHRLDRVQPEEQGGFRGGEDACAQLQDPPQPASHGG